MSNLVTLSSYGLLPAFYSLLEDDSIFDGFFGDRRRSTKNLTHTPHTPRVNIEETSSGYDIHMAAPGLSREDFKIHIDSGYLTVSAEAKDESEGKWLTREFSYTTFSRSWKLPANVNSEGISARYDAGILTVSVPTTSKKQSKVEIKVD